MLTDFARTLMGIDQSQPIDCIMHPGGRANAGFVTFFFYDDGRPLCLAKVARGDESSLRREAENLDAAASVLERSPLISTIDRTVGTADVGGRLVLFKSFSTGRPAAQVFSGKNRRATTLAFRNCCDWILQFIHDTREFRSASDDQKRQALSQIDTSGRSAPWIERLRGEQCPVHGASAWRSCSGKYLAGEWEGTYRRRLRELRTCRTSDR